MAIFIDDRNKLSCKNCNNTTFYERNNSTYEWKSLNRVKVLSKELISISMVCSKCNQAYEDLDLSKVDMANKI